MARATRLKPYPTDLTKVSDHVREIADRLRSYGVRVRHAIDATDGLVAVDTMPAMPPIALAVSVGARVPEPVRAAVRRAAASLTRDDQAERA